jgi:tetratricopeptide (TPR) repeat protein
MQRFRWFQTFSRALFLVLGLAQSGSSQATAEQKQHADFKALAESATTTREAGKTEDAIRAYQQALALRTDWEEGWWYLGTLQYDADHLKEAAPAFRKVVELNPAQNQAWGFLGLCEFGAGDYENAMKHLQKGRDLGLSDDPELSRVAQFHLALLLNRNGDFAKASSILTASSAEQASSQVKVALGIALLHIPLLPQEFDPSKDALVDAAGETAWILAQGDQNKTLISFRNLLRDYPDVPYLHYAYGLALASAGQNPEALTQQHEELRISPENALAQIEISRLELALQHMKDAVRAAENAARIAPDSPDAWRALANSQQALGNKTAATEARRRADAPPPRKPLRDARMIERYGHRASNLPLAAGASGAPSDGVWDLAMQAYEEKRYAEAISALKTFVRDKPEFGSAWAILGLCEFEMKDYKSSLLHLERGQELGLRGSTESVQLARYRLASLFTKNGEYEKSRDLLAGETREKARAKEVQFELGMTLLRIPLLPEYVEPSRRELVQSAGEVAELLLDSKYDAALPMFQTLLRQHPSVPFLHYAYGTALASLSQFDEAKIEFRSEREISPASELPDIRLAAIQLRVGEPVGALPSAKHAIELAPDSAEAHYLLGRTYLELGQADPALRELETAAKLAPSSPEVHFNLARAYAKSRRSDKEAEERAIFGRLNALAEQQRSARGDQSYDGPRDPNSLQDSRP